MPNENAKKIQVAIILLAVSVLSFWFGGWHIAWSENLPTRDDVLYIGRGIAIKFNYRFYGVVFESRFFDSPIISWLLGGIAVSAFGKALASIEAFEETKAARASTVASKIPVRFEGVIAEDLLRGRNYSEIGPIAACVNKLTPFHKEPTKEQAAEALNKKAKAKGADAIFNVTYEKRGITFTSWGSITASGTGVKIEN
ncbi:heavy metal-binding domain-containing protein [Devosia sp.]|uniref:heavy metal-binding domain-containing protein n=1 Tax=Devosia sp. TaxID=1871048 RepID=UPI00273306A5|nr:heavy metal-binding domain-containing protein [Devosia sp.]MDP2780910.1 heavy metal-binding domain-containing protein [Devosia sp.]